MLRLTAPYIIPWLLRLGARDHPDMLWSLKDRPHVALTFDDGPGRHTEELLDVLAAEKVPATFFVLGDRCERLPDVVRRIHQDGHTLALHGMTHGSLTKMSSEAIAKSWKDQREQLQSLVPGLPPLTLCRPPFGHAKERESALAREHGLQLVQMTCLPGRHVLWPAAWEEPPTLMARRVAREIRPGGIITLHDGEDLGRNDKVYTQAEVAKTTRAIVNAVRQQGLDFGTIVP